MSEASYAPSELPWNATLYDKECVVLAALFDRPARLEGGLDGLRQWIRMFGGDFLGKLPQEWQDRFCAYFESAARSKLFGDGAWFVDYKRLRIVALKETAS